MGTNGSRSRRLVGDGGANDLGRGAGRGCARARAARGRVGRRDLIGGLTEAVVERRRPGLLLRQR